MAFLLRQRVLDAAAGNIEILGYALDADEPAALKKRHLARRAAAEERVQHHVAWCGPAYDVVAGECFGERGGMQSLLALRGKYLPHVVSATKLGNGSFAIPRGLANTTVLLANRSALDYSGPLILSILDDVSAVGRSFREYEHILKDILVTIKAANRAAIELVPYHRIMQPEAALHRIQRLPEAGSRLAAIDRGVAHYPHDHPALLGDAEQFADDCLPFLRRPIVQGAVVCAQVVVWRACDSQVHRPIRQHIAHHI